MILNFFPF